MAGIEEVVGRQPRSRALTAPKEHTRPEKHRFVPSASLGSVTADQKFLAYYAGNATPSGAVAIEYERDAE